MIGDPKDDAELSGMRSDMDQLGMLAKEYVPVFRGLYDALIEAKFTKELSEDLVKMWAERLWLSDGDDE